LRHLTNILSIDQDAATLNVIEPENQVHECGFTGSGESNKSHTFARPDGQIQTTKHLHTAGVGKVHIFEAYFTARDSQFLRTQLIGYFMGPYDDAHSIGDIADVLKELQKTAAQVAYVINDQKQHARHHGE